VGERKRRQGAIEAGVPLARAVVVLVEPTEPGNVGAVARVLLNLGGDELRLVVADRRRRARLTGDAAQARARHAKGLLARATFHGNLRDALAGVARACAFSARTGRFRTPRATLDATSRELAAHLDGDRVALVFGREESGLTQEEVALCSDLVAIPAAGRDPVLNLSHAVALGLWELARARGARVEPTRRHAPLRLATAADRAALRDDYAALLTELGFAPDALGDLHGRILRRFMELFDRAGGEHADASMLRGLAVAVRRSARPGAPLTEPRADRRGSSGSPGTRPARSARGRRSSRCSPP
jgi:tRNA (cytidine32/uridine32-2'-O)-methyltransferase